MANKQGKRPVLTPEQARKTIGENLNFGAAEAYKLLRTNLDFALPGGGQHLILGVTSSIPGEGKSTTTINTAYTIAQTGRKVLLIEGDMRLSVLAKRLRVHSRPGLTNLLVGQCSGNDVLQKSGLNPNLWVMTAGDTPPNPAELLGSNPMEVTLKAMSEIFDVVLVDLPPVSAVSDALIISKHLDGIIVVVRQDYCTKPMLDEAIRQLRFAEAKILGFVMTDADTQKKGYKRYGYGDYGDKNSSAIVD